MQILKFTKMKNGFYNLLLEDDSKIKIHEDLILKYELLLTKKLPDDIKEIILKENNIYEIYEISVSYINKKLRSKKELVKYLKKKEYQEDDIKEVINLLDKQGYLNDEVYVTSYIHDRIYLSNEGQKKKKKDLSNLGIDNSLIEEKITVYDRELEKERIEKLVDKSIKLNNNKGSNLLKRKIQSNLINLGYDISLINEILNKKVLVSKDIYLKEYEKEYNKLSKKYSGKELEYKLKQKMYQKGFGQDFYE